MTDTKKARRSHKKLRDAIDKALAEITPKLRGEFPEFTELEIAKAISKRAQKGETRAWEAAKAYESRDYEAALQKAVEESMRRMNANPAETKRVDEERRRRVEDIRREQDERMRERQQEAELNRAMIQIGYRALAAKHHPDRGGSAEMMRRLNRGRDRLKTNC